MSIRLVSNHCNRFPFSSSFFFFFYRPRAVDVGANGNIRTERSQARLISQIEAQMNIH